MNVKKLAIIGAIALVVIGCVVAAGCTSTQQQSQTSDKVTEDIVGIWFCENNAKDAKETDIILADGTGHWFTNSSDGTVTVGECSWTKNADGTYLMKWSDEEDTTWTLNSAKDTITSSAGLKFIKKQITDNEVQNVLGPWYKSANKSFAIFNADGTGTINVDKKVTNFTWTIPELGKFKIVYLDGDSKGKESIWTYNREKDTLTTGGLNGSSQILVRPTESVGNLVISKIANNSVIGNWKKSQNYLGDVVEENTTFKNDGTGINVIKEEDGTITNYPFTWKKVTEKGYLEYFEGDFINTVYFNSDFDTYIEGYITIYTNNGTINADNPIVGTWKTKHEGNEYIETYSADGTGKGVQKNSDGTTENYTLTWIKGEFGYYVTYDDGKTFVYHYNSNDKTMEAKKVYILTNIGSVNKENPLVSTWKGERADEKVTATFKNDGTGVVTLTTSDSTKDYPMAWKKVNGGYFIEPSEKKTGRGFVAKVSNDGKYFIAIGGGIFTKVTA